MKRLPHNCRRCGKPCRDPKGQCIECEQTAEATDAAIKRLYDPKHTPALPFAAAGRRRRRLRGGVS